MAIGLIAGGWVASAVISKLINELVECAKNQRNKLGLEEELTRLKTGLPKIGAVLEDVDQGIIREKNEELEKWLWKLRDAAEQADDVMDEMEYNAVKKKVQTENKVSAVKYFFEYSGNNNATLKKLKKAVKAIDDVLTHVNQFCNTVHNMVESQKREEIKNRQTSPFLNVRSKPYGRVEEKQHIVSKLLNPVRKSEEVNFSVLPIIGAGGIGKTTLAQLVYNDSVVKNNFELRMWVCISNNFDVELLTKKLYESAFGQRADADYLSSIQTKLVDKLMSKKFLIVFDDAWNENDKIAWETFMAPLKCGKNGSMILLTTRMETVATSIGPNVMDPINLKGLNEGDVKGLLEEYAFRGKDPNNYKELVQTGIEIVKKLKGFPLAAKTVGGILCSDLSETHWTRILESELWNLENGPNDIMPALRLTYQHLPKHLKPCFSFCSIFPQDHIFIKDDLINMWVALGLVPRDFSGEKRPEDVGSEYFENMLKRSIFSSANPVRNAHLHYPAYTYCSITDKQFVGGYIMHDLMHDLSSFVSQGECFRSDRNKSIPIPPTVRHLYVHVGDCSELSNLKLKNVRTLILQFDGYNPTELVCVLNELLKSMTSLRLLTLFSLKLSEVPESIGDLLHLRYLSLSSFMLGKFPSSMAGLHYLETIVCGGFGFTNQANVLVGLKNLRHIIASESFVDAIAGIAKLTSLQELSYCVDKEIGSRISELSNMRELRRLAITNINDVVDHEEAKHANLRDKIGLNELILQWDTTGFDEKVFDHLQPNCNLKELTIRNYMGRRLPIWELGSLSSLVKFEISGCRNLIKLDEGLLRNPDKVVGLKELIIRNCNELKMPEKGLREFISLKKLDISSCPKIKLFSVLLLFPPPKLQFLRIDSYVQDCIEKKSYVKDIIANLTIPESSLLQTPKLHREEAELFALDHPGENSNWEVSLLRMRDYIGIWPPTRLIETPSMLFPPPKLLSLRIDSYVQDCIEKKSCVKDIRANLTIPESSLRQTLKLHTEEAELFVLDHPGENSNWEVSLLRMRDYIGIWPPTWLTETLSGLDSLCIDGRPSACKCYFNGLPYEMSRLLKIVIKAETTSDVCSSLDMAYPSDMSVLEQIYFATSHINCLQYLKKLTVALCSKTCSMPSLPVTLKELVLYHLRLAVIPHFFGNQSSDLWSLPSLVRIEIMGCPNLVSLAEGLFQKPQQFAALEKLKIWECKNLRELPQGGFNEFVSLKELKIGYCPKMEGQLVPECFLPSALQVLNVNSCGDLVANLSKALERVDSPSSLVLYGNAKLKSLPPREVFSRWRTLEILRIVLSYELTSLESLLGLSSVRLLEIFGCHKLLSPITSPSAGKKDEIEGMVEEGTIQTSNRPASTQPTPTNLCSSTNTEHEPLISVDELEIDNPLLLSIEPIRSLSSVRKLIIKNCSKMQSLPELLPIREELSLYQCSPELQRRCEESGEDWPKLSHIPKVSISDGICLH